MSSTKEREMFFFTIKLNSYKYRLSNNLLSIKLSALKKLNCLLYCGLIIIVTASCQFNAPQFQNRYVVLSPEMAEILYALECIDRIVGRTVECDFPLPLREIEIVGNFGQVNLERILALNPSLVFTSSLEQNEITNQLKKLKIKTVQLYPRNIDELFETFISLGEITGQTALADSLVSTLQFQFLQYKKFADMAINKPRVYLEIYGNPIMSADNSSFLGQLLFYAGGENIFPILARDYCRVNSEDVVFLNPDIIIITYPGVSAVDVKNRKGWDSIAAVINNQIYTVTDIDPDLLIRAGPRNVEGVQALREMFGFEPL
jgi:iron complex transport system substrate-binding protein